MSAESPTAAEPTFGYIPDKDALPSVLALGTFSRALVVDTSVRAVVQAVTETRSLWNTDLDLHEGLYWFQGVDGGDLLVQFGSGRFPSSNQRAELGDLHNDHPLAIAWNHLEDLWQAASPVPMPSFALHAPAVTVPGGIDVVVLDRQYISGNWTYTAVVEGHRQEFLERNLMPARVNDDPRAWVASKPVPAAGFGATLTRAKILGKFTNTLFSFRATRTTFRPYQFKPVLKLLQTGKARLLIADEVGLGKTIEAGLIWTELEARQEADRVLIVCPSSLLTKWKQEMEDRFDFDLTELSRSGLDEYLLRHEQNRLPRRHAYITSLERIRTWSGLDRLRELPPTFDLVIVDEAHAMRNADTKSYALGTQISDWADNLVFLTATPINLRQEDLLNLLELLAPEDYGDLADLESRLEPNAVINAVAARISAQGVDPRALLRTLDALAGSPRGRVIQQRPDYGLLTELLDQDHLTPRDVVAARRHLAELNTLSAVITRTRKIEVDDRKAKREERRVPVEWTTPESDFYAEYLQWCRRRAEVLDSPLYFAMQMPLRLASASLPMARRAVLDPVGFGELSDADDDEPTRARLAPPASLVAAARRLPESVDTKYDALLHHFTRLKSQGRQALLFTHSRPTLAYLQGRLSAHFRIAVLHGGVNRERRRTVMAEFRAGAYDFVLANRVASEGLDFEFCSAIVNYDLPWNPMEVEQRIGRIDRIGQKEETILVVNFVNTETIDERILDRLLARIGIFRSAIGALEPIIAETAKSLLRDGFDFKLTDAQLEQKTLDAQIALEEQRKGVADVADASASLLVSNDVDVQGLEDDLVRTGSYIGQQELALLLEDWARVDGAPAPGYLRGGTAMTLRGNPQMASRVADLARRQHRSGTEIQALAAQLRDELPISLMLDQELARENGGSLLTTTHPLVMAAVSVPGHRQARFASVQVPAHSDESMDGTFLVVLAKAGTGTRAGDEIWGEAIDLGGRSAGDAPVNDLLAALAAGELRDAPLPFLEHIERMADRASAALRRRHEHEAAQRELHFDSIQAARGITLTEQHQRKLVTLGKRVTTARQRNRGAPVIKGFETQIIRAQEKYERLVSSLESETPPALTLEPIAACVVVVRGRRAGA